VSSASDFLRPHVFMQVSEILVCPRCGGRAAENFSCRLHHPYAPCRQTIVGGELATGRTIFQDMRPPESMMFAAGGGEANGAGRYYMRCVLKAHVSAKMASELGRCTSGTCPDCPVHVALQLLACETVWGHTALTYHRTWETGVGSGNEGRRVQPFNLLHHLTSRSSLHHYNRLHSLRNRGN
jgi:hypothetical protein